MPSKTSTPASSPSNLLSSQTNLPILCTRLVQVLPDEARFEIQTTVPNAVILLILHSVHGGPPIFPLALISSTCALKAAISRFERATLHPYPLSSTSTNGVHISKVAIQPLWVGNSGRNRGSISAEIEGNPDVEHLYMPFGTLHPSIYLLRM